MKKITWFLNSITTLNSPALKHYNKSPFNYSSASKGIGSIIYKKSLHYKSVVILLE